MLLGVTEHLARAFDRVTVVARGRRRLQALEAAGAGVIEGCALDYREDGALRSALARAVAAHGPPELAVCWIHSTAPDAPWTVAAVCRPRRYVHVLGSAALDPARPDDGRRARFEALDGLVYTEVVLGFVHDGRHARWLTNDEIAQGVIAAIEDAAPRSVVGTVEPWSARP